MIPTYPCHRCEDREVGCHATCERYKEAAGKRREELEAKKQDAAVFNMLMEHRAAAILKMSRRNKRRGKQ